MFVGLPTSLNAEHLRGIKFRRLVLYDSTDFDGINFQDSNREFLLGETNLCLKNWRDHRWNNEFFVGFLPIKRPPLNNRLRAAVRISALKSKAGFSRKKKFEVGFVARPTGAISENQRVQWLLDLKENRPDLHLWGGLVGNGAMKELLSGSINAKILESCWIDKKIGFFTYFEGLRQSKVALAPRGYAPWTYRHFEAIYAKCLIVSSDLSHYEFLIPFPREGIVEVPDCESVVPSIERALELYENSPEIVDSNLEYLNNWLDDGMYSRNRRMALDRFSSQFDYL